jgi:proteasome accessory factor B
MVRARSLIRLVKLMLNVSGRSGQSVPELAARLGCTERTVSHDLQDLEAAGLPLTKRRHERQTRWFIADGHTRALGTPFTDDELLALYFGRHLLQSLTGTVFGEALQSALEKIEARISPAALRLLRQLDQSASIRASGFKEYARFRETTEVLREAIHRRRSVEIGYPTFGREVLSPRRVDPYQLWYQHGGLYLAAYCHTRQQVCTFAVERIRHVTPCPETFPRPADFNLEQYLEASASLFQGKPERIRLCFSRAMAHTVEERQWHPSQRSERLLTGEVEVTFHVAPEPDLYRWILSYGKDVEVLAPRKLRDQIRAEWLAALRGTGGRREPLTLRAEPASRTLNRRTPVRATKPRKRPPASGPATAPEET